MTAPPGTRARYPAPWRGLDQVRVTPDAAGLTVTAVATVQAGANPYLAAHFPALTILPGVFVLDAVQQAVLEAVGARDDRPPVLLALGSARFLRPLRAAERMLLRASVLAEPPGERLQVRAQCRLEHGPLTATVRALFGWCR